MFRKLFAAIMASLLVVGGLFAEEIKGAFKKFEDGKVTVTVDGKNVTYKVDPDAKQKRKTKDGTEKEFEVAKMLAAPFLKEGTKITLTVENDVVKGARPEFNFKGKGFKKKEPTDN